MSSFSPLPREVILNGDAARQESHQSIRSARRDLLFRETLRERCERILLGTAWSLHPKRIGRLWPLAKLVVSQLVEPDQKLSDLATMPEAGELAGIGHDLSVPTLVQAYSTGLFPISHFGPSKWLSPLKRCVLFFDAFHMPKRLKRLMRQGRYTVTFDRNFEGVIKACAGKRVGRWHLTWITPRVMHAYAALYDAGYAHSFEVWNEAGDLVGGGYGLAIGKAFFTESQFSREPNTSKLGFSVLNWHLARWGYGFNDGKWATPTILDMGFRLIPRDQFLRCLKKEAGQGGRQGRWAVEAGPEIVAGWGEETKPGAEARADANA